MTRKLKIYECSVGVNGTQEKGYAAEKDKWLGKISGALICEHESTPVEEME